MLFQIIDDFKKKVQAQSIRIKLTTYEFGVDRNLTIIDINEVKGNHVTSERRINCKRRKQKTKTNFLIYG